MAPTLVLHIGAHRTGTTSLQAALDAAGDVLARSGILALTPPRPGRRSRDTVRKLVGELVSAKAPHERLLLALKKPAAKRHFERLVSSAWKPPERPSRIILSDEKMLGRAYGKDGRAIYPFAARHLNSIRRMLWQPPDEIHLCIRRYDSFIVSAYAMRTIYAPDAKPFDTLRSKFTAMERGWVDLVSDIQLAFPDTDLFICEMENSTLDRRLHSLVGEALGETSVEQFLPPPQNRSPTLEAINHVLQSGQRPRNPDDVVRQFGNGTRFDPITISEKTALKQKYADDVARLRSCEGLHWIDA